MSSSSNVVGAAVLGQFGPRDAVSTVSDAVRRIEPAQRARLDAIDLQILEQLQRDAQQTNLQLAERVMLSPSACLARVKRLEKLGVIASYHAVVNLAAVVPHVRALAFVTLDNHRSHDFRRFDQAIAKIPAVTEAHRVNGGFDYVLTVVCSDVDRFREITERIADLGVAKIESHFVLSTPQRFSGYCLASLTPREA